MIVFPHWILKYLFLAFFSQPMIVYNYVPFPSLMPYVMEAYWILGFLLFWFFDNQWASVWSWLFSCACFTALAEPTVYRRFRVMDPEALAPDGQALRQGFAFRMAWHRFSLFKLVPWADAVQCSPEEAVVDVPWQEMLSGRKRHCRGCNGNSNKETAEASRHMQPPRMMTM
mmetsp:Transcript_36127/g.64890  ORF Transcript_36127/g.64890 Transcript_36127/m.64890 type:complete len:171 (-) Transcript_36127:10-522(-)